MPPTQYPGWQQPMCLVGSSPDGRLELNTDTAHALKSIRDPVVVVCILGSYRTGKSYLMNKLSAQQTGGHGFEMGATVEAKTKGVWIWCVPHPKQAGHCLLLMDTEGLGDPMKGDGDHDTLICVLAMLLSNVLVYNTVGTIDQKSLDNLAFVTKMADHVRVRASDDGDDVTLLNEISPSFVWAVRDFMLDLEIDGKKVTADQYMEHCLEDQKDSKKGKQNYDRIRRHIKSFFSERKCFPFPTPTSNKELLTHMERCPDKDAEQGFLNQIRSFCQHVHTLTSKRTIGGKPLNGSMLASLAKCYVECLRRGDVPCVENALKTTADRENARAATGGLDVYRRQMTQHTQQPLETVQEFVELHKRAENAALAHFDSLVVFDSDGVYRQQFENELRQEQEQFRRQNEAATRRKCEDELKCLYRSVEEAMKDGRYMKAGGYQEYKEDKTKFRKAYLGAGKGVMGREVLEEFLASTRDIDKFVQNADEKMTATQLKVEDERRRAEAQVNSTKEIKETLIRSSQESEKTFRELQKEKTERMRLEAENQQLLQVAVMQQKLIKALEGRLKEQHVQLEAMAERRQYQQEMESLNGMSLFDVLFRK